VGPQRVCGAARRRDRVQVDGGGRRGEAPARGGQVGELFQPGHERQHPAGQHDLRHQQQDQHDQCLLRGPDPRRHDQAQSHRRNRQSGDADYQFRQRCRQEGTMGRYSCARHADQHQHGGLESSDEPEHRDLGEQVGAGGQAGHPFPAEHLPFLDQLPHGAEPAGQGGDDDQEQQCGLRLRIVMAAQPGSERVEPDQAAEQYRQREKPDQLAPVRGDQGGITPRQDGQLGQPASRRRRGLGEAASGSRARPGQPDGHVLLVGR
jgi:hypothetical protein